MDTASFDWKKPNYDAVFAARMRRLAWIREDKTGLRLKLLKVFYRDNPASFINDWGVTFDPRNAEVDLPTKIPFILFPKQREWIDFVLGQWRERRGGLTEKSRDCGISWLAVALSCTLCLFHSGITIGFGSNKAANVDTLDDPKSLFFKARMFMQGLPPEFIDGWDVKRDAPLMRIKFPATGSSITGEAGDQIGRGGRTSIYFVDESAHLERPQLIDASLSATTNCRQDISSVNGMGTPFAVKRWGGKWKVFIFDWRDDPRKSQEWYDRLELDPVTKAQEVDRNYNASVYGALIPSEWVEAAVDAHIRLGIAPTGHRRGALDIADEGYDNNAYAGIHGPLLEELDEWSGVGSDIFGTVAKAFSLSDGHGYDGFLFDSDGLGAGARGDARVINEGRKAEGRRTLDALPFRGSGAVFRPKAQDEPGRNNEDFFANCKAQAWWQLRNRLKATFRAVRHKTTGEDVGPYNIDDIVSFSSKLPLLGKLKGELAQPTYSLNTQGKVVVDKAPDNTKSPNLADAVMIAYSRVSQAPMRISREAIRAIR